MATTRKAEWHEILNLKPTNLKDHYSRRRPPKGFNPLTATQDELSSCGLPSRPDPSLHPQEHARWRQLYGRAVNYIEPELVIRPHRTQGPLRGGGVEAGPAGSLIFSSNWSGNICFANPGQTFKEILGMWVVPSVSQPLVGSPFQNAGTWSSVAWVGLDGAASADVFQAGTEQDLPYKIEGSPVEIYYAWTEWFPAPPVAITNFPVGPGDTVNVFLQITGEFELFGFDFPVGQALFSNQTRGTFTTVNMGGPENGGPNAFQGNSAEWIIETPCTANCSSANAVFTALPYFGAVAFYFAEVYDSTGAAVLGSSGSFVSMDTSGNGIGRNGGAPGTGTGVATPLPDIIGSVATNGG